MKLPPRERATRGKPWKRVAEILLSSLFCALVIWGAIDRISFITRVNQLVQDWEIAGVFAPRAASQDPDILIVAIDEPTLRGFEYRSPVDRKFLSDLLQHVAGHGPRAIGLDISLDQPTETDKDAALRQTLAAARIPIIVSYIPGSATVSPEQHESLEQQAFQDAMVPAKDRGRADLATDQYDTARNIFPGAETDGNYMPGFARALAAAVGVPTPAVEVPIVWHGRPPATATDLNPRPFRQISARDAGLFGDSWFHGKIVLIGSDVTLVDRHRTPYSSIFEGNAGQLPGVVIQAHILSQLLNARQSPVVPWPVDLVIAFFFTVVGAGLGGSNGPQWLRIAVFVWITGLFWAVALALFHFQDVMIGLIAPPMAMAAGFVALDSLTGRAARKQRKFIQEAMARYVSPKLVEQMVDDPERLSLQGERRLMTYLFSDIENFTTMSEKMDSNDLALLLNAYLDGMVDIVLKHDGMVDKFIGDAVFAIFNAPLDLADHAQKGVECMLAMDRFTENFRKEQKERGISLGVTRIGVHTGVAVVGNFGSQARFTYTAQGDAVNTASRLEGINKYFGTRLCVSDATRLLCRDIAFRPIASVILKGKTVALDLWEPLHEDAASPAFLAGYEAAYDRLKAGAQDAEALFTALAAENPHDPCVRLHMERLRHGAKDVKMAMTEK
ncbi:MAG TPA: adenylate/guanylate cyclase domain-containing protein [Rhizomicrobium sp.]|nr:adenylate/guanylate cyclase domain-containing protein [Rhizomicrobium sp.]